MSKLTDAEAKNPAIVADITRVANSLGVPPDLALATAYFESGFNPQAVGDHGTSFGLYQLHQGGELGNLTPQQAYDPITNATVALSQVQHTMQAHPDVHDPGQIAALAQRPANPSGYALAVDDLLGKSGGSTLGNAIGTIGAVPGEVANGASDWLSGLSPGNILSDFLKGIITSGLVVRGTLMVVGIVILFIGLSQVAKADSTPTETVVGGTGAVADRVNTTRKNSASRGKEAAAIGAAAA